ncbi:MAG: hypothetical protein RLZZ283_548 [Candidatus Parcubacteria bacterium]|jgi:hypothetical protein
MSHEDTSKLTIEERRRRAIAIFNQLNKPGTVTRALVDLHRAGGPSGFTEAEMQQRFPAFVKAAGQLRRIGATIRADENKK